MTEMNAAVDRVLTALYARDGTHQAIKVVLAATGGGVAAAPLLFRAGSSSTMLQFSVPYARASLQRFVDSPSPTASPTASPLPKFVSREMAERMAESAWKQAQDILWDQAREESVSSASSVDATLARFRSAVGVGCTASLATNYDRRGMNQAFISLCRVAPNAFGADQQRCETFHVHFDKSRGRSREEEDQLVGQFVVYLLAKTAGADVEGCAALLEKLQAALNGEDRYNSLGNGSADATEASPLSALASNKLTSVAFLPAQEVGDRPTVVHDLPFKGLVLSGSFNPLHRGHVDLALAAQRLVNSTRGDDLPIAFEISVDNADKGSIATSTVEERIGQFVGDASSDFGKWPVLATNAKLFSKKAELLRGCVFVIGADTAVRLVDKKYYDMDEHKMILALKQIADHGCWFVVAGRFDEKDTKRFISAEEVCSQHIPPALEGMFVALREDDFRNDLSSTQLRNGRLTAST
jgi:hypothetical protein